MVTVENYLVTGLALCMLFKPITSLTSLAEYLIVYLFLSYLLISFHLI